MLLSSPTIPPALWSLASTSLTFDVVAKFSILTSIPTIVASDGMVNPCVVERNRSDPSELVIETVTSESLSVVIFVRLVHAIGVP